MKALQVYYTSCRNGLAGRPGFQIRSTSAGISPVDLAEIEARNSYRPPLDAPAAPSNDELRLLFPVALRSYRLPGGGLALTRTAYSGRDYSGRWGNFFAHTLVFGAAGDALPPGWPIDYFDWPGWVGGLTPAEDTEEAPAPLPAIEIARTTGGSPFGFAELSRFLAAEPWRESLLAAMLEALLRGLPERRPVVVRASPLDLPRWIGCLQKLLPRGSAWNLVISTYEDDPQRSVAITGTSGQTYFDFGLAAASRLRIWGFDLKNEARCEVGGIRRYAATAASWLCHRPDALERYFRWLESLPLAGDDLEPSLELFRLLEGDDRALENDTEKLLELASRTPGIDPRRVFEAFLALRSLPTLADESAVFRYLILESRGMAGAWPDQVEDAWLARAFPAWIEERPTAQIFGAFWRNFRNSSAERFAAAARRWLADLGWLPALLPNCPSDEVVHFLLALSETADRPRIWRDPSVKPFFERTALHPGGLEKILGLAGRDGGDLLDLFDLLGRSGGPGDRALGRALGEAIATWPEAPLIRQVFEQAGAWEVLFGEWLGRLDTCSDAVERSSAFAEYTGAVLAQAPLFRQEALSLIRFTLMADAPPGELLSAVRRWLQDGSLHRFPPDLFRQCIGQAVADLPVDSPDDELDELAELLVELAQDRELRFSPDRARLRLFLRPGRSTHLGKRQLDDLVAALEGLDEAESRHFLRRFLGRALRAADKDLHEKLMAALDLPALRAAAPAAYGDALRDLDDPALFRLARFWVQLKDASGLAQRIAVVAEEFLIDWLAGHPAQLEEAKVRFSRLRDDGAGWPRWLKRIEKRRRNPLFRARGWCSGVFEKISMRRQ